MPGPLGDQQGGCPVEAVHGLGRVVVPVGLGQLGRLVGPEQQGDLAPGGRAEGLGHVDQQGVAGRGHHRPPVAARPSRGPVEPVHRVGPLQALLGQADRSHGQHHQPAAGPVAGHGQGGMSSGERVEGPSEQPGGGGPGDGPADRLQPGRPTGVAGAGQGGGQRHQPPPLPRVEGRLSHRRSSMPRPLRPGGAGRRRAAGLPGGPCRPRDRPGEVVALGQVAAELGQGGRLLGLLHALGHGVQMQGAGQSDDGPGHRRLLGPARDPVHERLVDLDGVDRHPPQVGQRGVAGAEVVDGQVRAEPLQLVEADDRHLKVVHQDALGDLQGQALGGEPGVAEGRGPRWRPGRCGDRWVGGQIDVQGRQRAGVGVPAGHLAAGLAQHEPVEDDHQAGLLGQGDELGRQHQAAVGPARVTAADDPSAPAAKPTASPAANSRKGARRAGRQSRIAASVAAIVARHSATRAPIRGAGERQVHAARVVRSADLIGTQPPDSRNSSGPC